MGYFSVPKDVKLNSAHNLIMKINNKKELQNIAINHSADLDYKGFVRIYRKCIRKLYSFLIIDTMLPADDPFKFRKTLFSSCKDDSNDQSKKIMQNEAQYDLRRKAAKISALSSNKLDKYEYLAGEDLDLKPSTVEQAKFEYSPLGRAFNRGLKDEDKKKKDLWRRSKVLRIKTKSC